MQQSSSSANGILGAVRNPQHLTSDEVITSYGVDPSKGLSRDEAARRRALRGVNKVTPPVNCPSWICCLLPCLVRTKKNRQYQEFCPHEAVALRAGRKLEMDALSLVVGDIIYLKAGDIVPADARLIEASELKVDKSNLTGDTELVTCTAESIPGSGSMGREEKQSYRDSRNVVLMSTVVAEGSAIAVVIATGDRSYWSELIRSGQWPPSYTEDERNPFVSKKSKV